MLDAIHAVSATAVDRNWVPPDLRDRGLTFFSTYDIWLYHAVFDEKLCQECLRKAVPYTYAGTSLRREFPYLVILGPDRIGGPDPDGSGLIHPHCRCYLERLIEGESIPLPEYTAWR